jgi:hypothetical protein
MRKQWAWWVIAILVLIVLLYPQRLTVVPAYHVKLVDPLGSPLVNTGVSELWQQTSVQPLEHLEQVMTNAQGEADLPEQTIYAPLAEQILGCLAYLSREGLTATCGNHFSISGAGHLKELERVETTTGVLKRRHSLMLTLKYCDPDIPLLYC